MYLDEFDNFKVGRYKYESVCEVADIDREYLQFLLDNCTLTLDERCIINSALGIVAEED